MVKIRLARHGTKKKPFYRMVVADSRAPRNGRLIDSVGMYDPTRNPVLIQIKKEKLEKWLRCGAQPTETVAHLIKKAGFSTEGKSQPITSSGGGKQP